ncbi:lipoprotein [Spiroplasma alleghenense]|uniref:Lipoprotein n=1 Tax=Spiroplasma alleghenense TaxID=216931 RepID=A0A345Z3Q1_9MOLU|nr:lipoprotein [Spiroplasma alleghenense]AXK51230.1 hypothetical protein SALLE_v1c05560 [Spiroplasma alleghenense]
MKKLLGLLAAFGLTASAGSAVVACGDPKTDENKVDAVEVVLTVTLKADAKQADVEAAIAKLDVKAEGPKEEKQTLSEKAAVEAVKAVEGVEEAVVKTAKDGEATTFESKVKVSFTEKAVLVDITGIVIDGVKVGDEGIEEKVQTEIAKLAKDAKKDTDYTITGDTKAEGKIKVEAKKDSKLIKGEFEITVAAADVDGGGE